MHCTLCGTISESKEAAPRHFGLCILAFNTKHIKTTLLFHEYICHQDTNVVSSLTFKEM